MLILESFVAIAFAVACYLATRFAYRRDHRAVFSAILSSVPIAVLAGKFIFVTTAMMALGFGVFAIVSFRKRRREIVRWRDAPADALILERPVLGRWQVAIGGPFSKPNHHTTLSSERFAYDLVRCDGESFGSQIVAPIAGIVEHVRTVLEDGVLLERGRDRDGIDVRYGNFVSIRTGAARVLLCHLEQHSIVVEADAPVIVGQYLGRCGQSGRTFEPHLHIHAQDVSAQFYGDGIPIVFAGANGPMAPVAGDRL